jgi:hypothetical protein
MKTIISASRRTDLPAGHPDWLAAALRRGEITFRAPRGADRTVDLRPSSVHTIVLWSKDFGRVLSDDSGLGSALRTYRQTYFLFTITGLGGSIIEPDGPAPGWTLEQIPPLVELAGDPRRVSLRFDPIVHWRESGGARSNLDFFETLAAAAGRSGIKDIRFSFAQWYGRSLRRARVRGLDFLDPSDDEKAALAADLAAAASARGLRLHSCAQDFLRGVPGLRASACIDGRLLAALHPDGEPARTAKDRSQRPACGCTESVDIGSYDQACPFGCVYCYANPAWK